MARHAWRPSWRNVLVALLCATAPPAATAGEVPAWLVRLPAPAELGRLVQPESAAARGLVVVLPDALDEDGRSDLYVDALLARGLATLVLGLAEDADDPALPAETPPGALVPPALAWATQAGFHPRRIGLLGFGRGGRAALASDAGPPSIALYPVCVGLPAPVARPALIIQGGDDAQGCDRVAASSTVTLRRLPGAGHAWDAPGAIWPSPGPALPDPAGTGRRRARMDAEATRAASEIVAAWFENRLVPPASQAAR